MLKRLNPEISIGFLIASLFWIGVLGWQASYAPTENEKRECQDANKKGQKNEECKNIWERTTTDPVAFFTFWLVVSTIGLGFSTILLWRATRRSVQIAERALTELEAPFLTIKINDAGIHWGLRVSKPSFSELKFTIANYGRTPAHIFEVIDGVEAIDLGGGLPPVFDLSKKRGRPMPYGVIAAPNGESQEFGTITNVDFFEESDPKLFPDVTKKAFFRGFVRYGDIFRSRYVMGFCFVFDPKRDRWVLMGGGGHNYCRRESGAEFPDWMHPSADPGSVRSAINRAVLESGAGE